MTEKNSRAEVAAARKEQILAAALKVLSQKGFLKATNKDIAEAAGIASAGLIYHYFRDRSDLLMQVMTHYHPVLQLLDKLPTQSEPRLLHKELLSLAAAMNHTLADSEKIAVFRVVAGELLHNSELVQHAFDAVPGRVLNYLDKLFAESRAYYQSTFSDRNLSVIFMGPFLMRGVGLVVMHQDVVDFAIEEYVNHFLHSINYCGLETSAANLQASQRPILRASSSISLEEAELRQKGQ